MRISLRILIAVCLAAVLAGNLTAQTTKEVRKSGPFNSDGKLFIDTYKGSITVSTWDKAEIDIFARVEPDEYDRDAEEKVQDTEIRIDASKPSVRIKTDYDRVRRHSGGFWGIFDGNTGSLPLVHYTIKVPRTAQVVIKDYKSATKIKDLRSDVEIETYKGTVEVTNLEGSLMLETYKGDVRAEFASLSGRSRFETYKGYIEVALPRKQGFDLDLDVGSKGNWSSDFDINESYRKGRRSDLEYRGSVNGGGPRLQFKTTKGTIRLASR